MKKLICPVLFLLVLCGCSQKYHNFKVNPDSVNTSFSSEFDDMVLKGTVFFDSEMNMTLKVTYPENINGLMFYFNNDTVTTSYDGVSNTYKYTDLTGSFIFSDVYRALKYSMHYGEFTINDESSYSASYDGITIIADKEGNITSLTLKNGHLVFGI